MADLTPEEIKFFETGDASVLGLAPSPAPAPIEDAAEPAPAPIEAPTPAPIEAPAPAPAALDPAAELRTILAQEQARRDQLERTINNLTRRIEEATAPAPAPAPDPAQDPIGTMLHKLSRITEEVEALKSGMTQATQAQQQQAEFQSFVRQMQAVRDDFSRTTPDFSDAYKYLREVRAEDLRAVGVPETDIPRALLQDEIAVAHNAMQRGQNPAQTMYNMARRYGYAPKAPAPSPAAKIESVTKGQAAAVAPAKAEATSELTTESLRDAGNADLDKIVQDDRTWRRLMGGDENDIF